MSVNHLGKNYKAREDRGFSTLDLSGEGIKDITEINGLKALTKLHALNLSNNQISEIKGLEPLENLIKLDLSFNEISEIKGLNNLRQLRNLNLKGNRFINIEGLENLVNLDKITFGFAHWDTNHLKPGERPRKTLILNGSELTTLEKDIIKGSAKKVVAYCRVKLKQAGYAKRLVPVDSKIEKFEKQILKMMKDNEKKVKKAIRKVEMAQKQSQKYFDPAMRR